MNWKHQSELSCNPCHPHKVLYGLLNEEYRPFGWLRLSVHNKTYEEDLSKSTVQIQQHQK